MSETMLYTVRFLANIKGTLTELEYVVPHEGHFSKVRAQYNAEILAEDHYDGFFVKLVSVTSRKPVGRDWEYIY